MSGLQEARATIARQRRIESEIDKIEGDIATAKKDAKDLAESLGALEAARRLGEPGAGEKLATVKRRLAQADVDFDTLTAAREHLAEQLDPEALRAAEEAMLRGGREYVDQRAAELQAKARAILEESTSVAAEIAALRAIPGAPHPSEIDGALHYATVHIAGIGGVLDPEPDAEEVARIASDLGPVTQDLADVRRLGERANALRRLRTLESAPASHDRDQALERFRREEQALRLMNGASS